MKTTGISKHISGVIKSAGFFILGFSLLTGYATAGSSIDRKPAADESATATMQTFDGLRNMRYCELFLIHKTEDGGVLGEVFNTSGLNGSDPLDSCPAGIWEKVDTEAIKAEYHVMGVFKNGPRHWTVDKIKLPAAEPGTISGLQARWFMHVKLPKDFGKEGATYYKPTKGLRNSVMTWEKDKPLFILDDPEGRPWVMQAFTTLVDPNLSYEELENLGAKLDLPPGWKFRVKVIEKDLVIKAVKGFAWIVQDNLQGTYDLCFEEDGQKACSFMP